MKYLCTSRRQAINKLLEKRNKDKRHVSNWGPVFAQLGSKKYIQNFSYKTLKSFSCFN